jgi:hypothetical protein
MGKLLRGDVEPRFAGVKIKFSWHWKKLAQLLTGKPRKVRHLKLTVVLLFVLPVFQIEENEDAAFYSYCSGSID